MKQILLSMSAFAFLLGSCSTAKTDEVIPEDWYLASNTATQYTAGNITAGPENTHYFYNASKTLHAIEYDRPDENSYIFSEFVYDNGRLTKMKSSYAKGAAAQSYLEFVYSGQNLVKILHGDGQSYDYADSLVYDNNKIVKVFTENPDKMIEYKWENDNIVEIRDYRNRTGQMQLTYIQQFTYSNIANPAKTAALPYYIWSSESNPSFLCANKVKTRTIAGADGIPYSEFTFTNALNEKGLSAGDTTRYRDITGVNPPNYWVSKLTYVNLSE